MLTPIPPSIRLLDKGNSFDGQANLKPLNDAVKSKNGLMNSTNRRDSFVLFNNILEKVYKKMAFSAANNADFNLPSKLGNHSPAPNIAEYQKVDKISSEQAADNILSFISNRLQMDEANGASKEALLNRLDQGLEGFLKGFNEAKEQIEGMGLLTPNLANEIADTYTRVTDGIETLRKSINGEQVDTTNLQRIQLAGEASGSKSFSLELTTQDGDRVIIDISRNNQTSFAAEQTFGSSSALSFNQQSSSSSAFNLNVTGELDDDELVAINKLLQDVDKIAGDFFDGNLDKAFEQALNLQINRDELSSLNLQLQKTTTVKAMAAYESAAQEHAGRSHSSPVKDLNQLFDSVQNILAEARKFAEPLNLIKDITAGVNGLLNEKNSQQNVNNLGELISLLASKFDL